MVDLNVGIVVLSEDGNLAFGTVVQCLMDEVQDGNLVLLDLHTNEVSSVCSKVKA
jgi:hypothetical protein